MICVGVKSAVMEKALAKECPERVLNRLLMVMNGNVNAGAYSVNCAGVDCPKFVVLQRGAVVHDAGCALAVVARELSKKWIWE